MTLPVTAIVVTYFSDAVLQKCLTSLKNLEEIIVIDNGGTAQPEGVTFLRNKRNIGFGRAINRALKKVKTPYVLIINPDAELQPEALEKLRALLETYSDAAIVSPLLQDGEGFVRTSWRLDHFRPRARKRKQEILGPFCAGHIAAAVWLVKTDALKKIGGFDKKIFLFFEDDDVTLRMREAGYSVLIEPTAQALHLQGQSSRTTIRSIYLRNFQYAVSQIYFTRKHRGKKAGYRVLFNNIFNNFFRMIFAILHLDEEGMIAAYARIAAIFKRLP